MPDWYQAWVTVALDDWDSLKALVLARSLRRVITTRRLVILISKDVSQHVRKVLEEEFDVVWRTHIDTEELGGVTPEVYIRAQCWKLTIFKKCIFVNPDLFVIKNCDDLFDRKEFSATVSAEHFHKHEPALFVFDPQVKTYNKIEKFCTTKKIINGQFKDILGLCFGEPTESKYLPEEYNAIISTTSSYSQSAVAGIKVVYFGDVKPWNTFSKQGKSEIQKLDDFGKALHHLWLTIFSEDVHPTLSKETLSALQLPQSFPKNELHFLGYDPLSADTYESMSETVAIIGLSCKFPSANNTEEFWKLLVEGKDCMREVPHERWDTSRDPKKTIGGFIDAAVDEFDAKFFGISPREAIVMDPQQRFLLESTWEALENAGINPQELKGTTTGVFMGFWNQDYQTILKVGKATNDFLRSYLGNAISASSARVSFFLGCNGPNMATESGCSSALLALHLACQSLQRKDCNLAVSGGINLILVPYTPHNQAVAHVLAPDGHCKTFDEKADGFGRGEGCGVIVLKRLSDAIRDDDNILALVRASAFNQEGTTSSFGTPSKYCQEKVIEKALRDGNIQPQDVTYVEAHGTGTLVGDPIEVAAIGSAYAKGRDEPLMIGSVKTNIGHSESAAGIAGLIKVVLSLQHQTIPPHINFQTLNPYINLEETPVTIPVEPTKWVGNKQGKRLGALNSFGMSGTNVHVILEEAPKIKKFNPLKTIYKNEAPQHLLNISAKTETALNELIDKYRHLIKKNPELSLNDICYTANVGRARFAHRASIVAKDLAQMETLLDKKQVTIGKSLGVLPKIGFLFTGQGSQYNGMAKQLYQTHPVFRTALDKCAKILQNNYNERIFDVMWHDEDTSRLDQTMFSQTAIFCIEYSLIQLWKSFGVEPDIVFGHSVGEFAAAAAAGVLSLEDALKLVSERSKLIQELPTGGMMAVKASPEVVESLIDSVKKTDSKFWLDIAVVNSEDEVVVAGRPEALDKLGLLCNESDPPVKSQRLAATHAFHSRDMETILPVYGKIAETVTNNVPKCGYISGATGKLLEASEFNSKYWQKHARDPVNFKASMETLFEQGVRIFIEVGPQPILLALGMTNLSGEKAQESVWIPSIRKTEEEWVTVFTSISKLFTNGFDINWKDYYSIFPASKVLLPNYPFQRQKFWVPGTDVFNLSLLHPLLGKTLSLVTNDSFYEHNLNLDWLPYLNDHKVADKFIVPGAGLLEMILASGHVATSGCDNFVKPVSTLVVEDFNIEAALEIDPDKPCRTQVVVTKAPIVEGKEKEVAPVAFEMASSQSPEMEIGVYLKDTDNEGNVSWRRHARGRFTAYSALYSTEAPVDIDTIKKRCNVEINTADIYKRTHEAGVQLGPMFQSVKALWRNSEEVFAELECGEDAEQYVCHPIILDALIQVFGFKDAKDLKGTSSPAMVVPIGLDKFTIFPHEKPEKIFGYIRTLAVDVVEVCLLNEKGEELAVMKGVRLVMTSIQAFMNALTYHKREVTGMYQEYVRHKLGPLMSRVNCDEIPGLHDFQERMADIIKEGEDGVLDYREPQILLNKTVYLAIMYAFHEMGWSPKVGQIIQVNECITKFEISPSHEQIVARYMELLSEGGYLKPYSNTEDGVKQWQVISLPMEFENSSEVPNFKKAVEAEIKNSPYADEADLKIILQVADNLPEILQKKFNPLSALFPKEGEGVSASAVYTDTKYLGILNKSLNKAVHEMFSHVVGKSPGEILRILEVGAGTGATTKVVIAGLQESKIPFTYTFTDVSPHFLFESKEHFKDISSMEFKLLNIEKDPKSQSFAPYSYDLVLASNVLHATERIVTSIRHCRHLLRPGGLIVIGEMIAKSTPIDFIFGVLPDYWRFKDHDLRTDHPSINPEQWAKVLLDNGFSDTKCANTWGPLLGCIIGKATNEIFPWQPSTIELEPEKPKTWMVFSNGSNLIKLVEESLKTVGKDVIVVRTSDAYTVKENKQLIEIPPLSSEDFKDMFKTIEEDRDIEGILYSWGLDETNQEIITGGFLNLGQFIVTKNVKTKVIVLTKGNRLIGDQLVPAPHDATLRGFTETMLLEQMNADALIFDIDPDQTDDNTVQELMYELWSNTTEFLLAYRNKKKHMVRINKISPIPSPLTIPKTEQYKIQIPESKSLNDLVLVPLAKKEILDDTEVEVEIRATGLNFRDLFVIIKPDLFHYDYNEIGMECGGTVSRIGKGVTKFKVGDEVFGLSTSGAIASHTITKEDSIMLKPASMTFAQAATVPITFFTAYHCLIEVAKIQKGETVLVHVASGGVGLAAIQICKKVGAIIIGTAGSKRKRQYLHDLGIEHVFHSRNDSFGDDIMRVTNGVGVDMVLNSLTGTNMKETSLRVCKPNARFVEMSKIQIWKPEEVEALRPDVAYTIVNLEKGFTENDAREKIQEKLDQGEFLPLPYTQFDITQTIEAFFHFQKALQIGKIVITMPKLIHTNSKHEVHERMFNEDSTYLITGGMGGIGMEVTRWMTQMGAKNIVLIGRQGPTPEVQKIIDTLNNTKGKHVLTYQVDVGDVAQLQNLLDTIKDEKLGLPPLRGIIHSAGTLSDGVIANQTWEKFQGVYTAKVNGTWNLHNLTKDYLLEHFVLFSSGAALFGPLAQSNHAAANAFMDSFTHYRHSLGLPAQSINWGIWGEVGAAASLGIGKEGAWGIKPFSPKLGIGSLKAIMRHHMLQTVAIEIHDASAFTQMFKHLLTYCSELTDGYEGPDVAMNSAECERFWKQIRETEHEKRHEVVKALLEKAMRQTLKLPDEEPIDEHQSFKDMGMDSLMAVEMRNRLQGVFGKYMTLNATSLMDYPNLAGLSNYLAEQTFNIVFEDEGESSDGKTVKDEMSTEEEESLLSETIKEDSVLPQEIQSVGPASKPSEIKCVLLTGAAGTLGLYVLNYLTNVTKSKIICLLRAKTDALAKTTLMHKLKRYNLLESTKLENVVIVSGSIADPTMGLHQDFYTELCGSVDAIIHCAIKASHIEKYKKSANFFDIRTMNVIGTINILKFATTTKTKHLIYPSSHVAANALSPDGKLVEELPTDENNAEGIAGGYAISKFICEKLIRQAIERGIPCKVLRLPSLVGHSVTGYFDIGKNHMMAMIMACLQLKVFPKEWKGTYFTLPVDIAAVIAVKSMLNDNAESGLYNVLKPEGIVREDLLEIYEEYGHSYKEVDAKEFAVIARSSNNMFIAPFLEFYESEDTIMKHLTSAPALKIAALSESPQVFYHSEKINKLFPGFDATVPPPKDTIRRHIKFGSKEGMASKLGIS